MQGWVWVRLVGSGACCGATGGQETCGALGPRTHVNATGGFRTVALTDVECSASFRLCVVTLMCFCLSQNGPDLRFLCLFRPPPLPGAAEVSGHGRGVPEPNLQCRVTRVQPPKSRGLALSSADVACVAHRWPAHPSFVAHSSVPQARHLRLPPWALS